MDDKSKVHPNLDASKTDRELINEVLDFSVTVMLDTMDHTSFYYKLSRSKHLVSGLLISGITDPRIKLMHIMHRALDKFVCLKCNSKVFNYECPVIVCNKCMSEYILVSKPSMKVCKMCPASDLGTCEQRGRLITEYSAGKFKEKQDEYSYAIVRSEPTTLQKSPGNLEFYTHAVAESQDSNVDGVRETHPCIGGQVFSIQT